MGRKMNHKYHRGDRFIIEIAEVHTHYKDNGDPYPLYRIKGFDSMVMTNIALDRLAKQNTACNPDRKEEENDIPRTY